MNQLPYHLNLAKENGISEEELVEVITQLAFYVGWPRAASAIQVAKEVFCKEQES
ncbi:Carboxymuconolactone decarboxylase family protein [compost metagenome]